MRLKTPVLVLVGFISLATFTQAVSPSGSQAVPLKHRILSEAKNGGSNEEGNSKVQLTEIQGGIMDKVTPSKLTLAQEDEEKKEEKVEESTTSSSNPNPESGTTDTSNVESVRSALTGFQAIPDNQKQLQYDNFGQPVLDFGNRVKS
jgi:hypothetical protein